MTLILSVVTQDCAYLVSDRRLTWTNGTVATDTRNKLVFFNGVLGFGYTGLALIDGIQTDLWLARTLADPSCSSGSAAIEFLATAATDAIRRTAIPPTLNRSVIERTAFLAAGWTRPSRDQIQPVICQVSNYHDELGQALDKSHGIFRAKVQVGRNDERFIVLHTGQNVVPELMNMLRKRVRVLIKAGRPRDAILRTLVKVVRASAVRNTTIGQDLLSLCIPRPPASRQDSFMLSGGPEGEWPTFQNWTAQRWDGESCGPAVVAEGNVLSNVRVGSSVQRPGFESLGGLIISNGLPHRLNYPCCVLFNELTDCYMSVSHTASPQFFLAIFTSEEAITENLRRSPDRLVRHWLRSAEEVVNLLKSIRGADMIMLNPNAPTRGITFSTSKNHLLELLQKK